MNTINAQIALPFAWLFVVLALFFALSLSPKLASHFYPTSPSVVTRLAAPIIFAILAIACAQGIALQALAAVTILGLTQIVRRRRI